MKKICFFIYNKRFVTLGAYIRRMGRRNKGVNIFAQKKRDRKEQLKNGATTAQSDNRRTDYEDIVKENASFEEYYKKQKVCPEEDWSTFLTSLRTDLPTAFRITGYRSEANVLMNIVKSNYFAKILNYKLEDGSDNKDGPQEEIKPINLPWYPGGVAWQLRLSRTSIRRSEPMYRLHNFLVAETAAGGVSRQETVSMIPPVVLDVKPHHKVLDMCAAPGSKTAQLIEFLHADEGKMPTGLVVANDVDNNRCYMLVHQAKRLNSPCILITNHDSAFMPNMYISDAENPGSKKQMKFDRILCDVPCSGDATLRKNADIWLKWSPGNGNNLHGIQYRILKRGVELLELGGRLVYSTCSFNPIENEAVIHRLLQEIGDSVHLVDVTHMLPGLIYKKGLSHWYPGSKDMVFYDKYEDVPEKWQTVVRPQMFPPNPEDADKYHLDKCIRILPHHQDTGGFFVAVLEKKSPLPWEKSILEPTERPISQPPQKKRRLGRYKEDPFVFLKDGEDDVFKSIKKYFDLSDNFDPTCLLTRCFVGKKKNIYLVSPIVKDIVDLNQNNITIINTGVKTFVRCDSKNVSCSFRLSQEGLMSIVGYIGDRRKVTIPKSDLIALLQTENPNKITELSQSTNEAVINIETGSCVLLCVDPETDLSLTLVGWKGVMTLRTYTTSHDTVHYLRLLGGDLSKYDINKFNKKEVTEKEPVDTTADDSTQLLDQEPTTTEES